MDRETMALLYGVEDEAGIYTAKESGLQRRAMAAGSDGLTALTAEECKKLCKKANVKGFEYLSGYEARVVQYTITDETVDRYGDIVRAKGVMLDDYVKNSVIQFAHDYSQPPVGISLKSWYDKAANCVRSLALFYDDRVDKSGRADLIFRFVISGGMPGCSIGFNPIAVTRPDPEERTALGMGEYGVIYESCDLMEFSSCAVPANPNALTDSLKSASYDRIRKAIDSGVFGERDVRVLRDHSLGLPTDLLDSFVKRVSTSVPVPEIPGEPVEPVALASSAVELTAEPAASEESVKKVYSLVESLAEKITSIEGLLGGLRSAIKEDLSTVLAAARPTETPPKQESTASARTNIWRQALGLK